MRKLERERRGSAVDEESNFKKKCTICLDVYTVEVSCTFEALKDAGFR